MAQNGGQYPENNSVKLEWVGTSVKVTNKQSCQSVMKVSYAQSEVDLTIAGNSSMIFMPPAAIATIKAKCTTNCGNTDFGWVELTLTAMPIRFTSFNLVKDYETLYTVKFSIDEAVNVHKYYIMVSKDFKTWIKKDSVIHSQYIKSYSQVINLK